MSQFGSVGPDGKVLEEGIGAPPQNVHLLAHQAAVRTQEMAAGFAARALALHEDAKALVASAEDAKKRSLVAHKKVLEAQAPAPVVDADKKALEDRAAKAEARVAELEKKPATPLGAVTGPVRKSVADPPVMPVNQATPASRTPPDDAYQS